MTNKFSRHLQITVLCLAVVGYSQSEFKVHGADVYICFESYCYVLLTFGNTVFIAPEIIGSVVFLSGDYSQI